ncbi:MAG: cytochrome c [Vicinamibacterales bacterium]
MRMLMFGLIATVPLMTIGLTAVQKEPPPGRAPYLRVCAACHGENAEGSQGPRLAGIQIDYDEFLAKVRHGGGEMPAIPKTQITDEEARQIFDYLTSM